jgi:hypothetical protein
MRNKELTIHNLLKIDLSGEVGGKFEIRNPKSDVRVGGMPHSEFAPIYCLNDDTNPQGPSSRSRRHASRQRDGDFHPGLFPCTQRFHHRDPATGAAHRAAPHRHPHHGWQRWHGTDQRGGLLLGLLSGPRCAAGGTGTAFRAVLCRGLPCPSAADQPAAVGAPDRRVGEATGSAGGDRHQPVVPSHRDRTTHGVGGRRCGPIFL